MRVVITAATGKELEPVEKIIGNAGFGKDLQVSFLVSGVGMLSSCFSITKLIYEQQPAIIIQAGIAGAFDESLSFGKVVAVRTEYIGDLGVEENGVFKDVFDMDLVTENEKPFIKKQLTNPHLSTFNLLKLDEVSCVTVNEITTQPNRIKELKEKYAPAIETMEGAALHYCCLQTNTPFIQLRSISNMIGERDKSKWNFELAFNNLAKTVSDYILKLSASNLR